VAENAPGTIKFFKAEPLDEGSYAEAMAECEVVFHHQDLKWYLLFSKWVIEKTKEKVMIRNVLNFQIGMNVGTLSAACANGCYSFSHQTPRHID
jgi:hypothetical protein